MITDFIINNSFRQNRKLDLFNIGFRYTANGVNCNILIANSKPQVSNRKFQILAFKAC